jgi:hypothetical protein
MGLVLVLPTLATGTQAGNVLKLRGELASHPASLRDEEEAAPSVKASSTRWRV